jgi:DNA-binding PadR family transcriptional regulator
MTMAPPTDKMLLLLGILKGHDLHGYGLSELLKAPGLPLQIGKANAYQLLEKLEQKGWTKRIEERHGRRPPRGTYSITPEGERAFEAMLRARLAESVPAEHPDAVALNFLPLLPAGEVLPLLEKRLELLRGRRDAIDAGQRASHHGVELVARMTELEVQWLEELILALETEQQQTEQQQTEQQQTEQQQTEQQQTEQQQTKQQQTKQQQTKQQQTKQQQKEKDDA